jgi:universal stress protein A
MAEWKKICCAVDFSQPSRIAMEEAADLARRFGAALTLVYVQEAAPLEKAPLPAELSERALEMERKMASWREEAARLAGRSVRSGVLAGDPAGEIVRFVRGGDFDLLVVATHRRLGLKHVALGSVAAQVVRDAPCPVLVARRPASKARGEG